MKKIIEKLRAAEQKNAAEKVTEARSNYGRFIRANEKTMERAARHVNRERRNFLEMLAKAGIAAPVLKASTLAGGIFASRYAMAAGGPKRVIYCYLDSGAAKGSWMPTSATSMNAVTAAYGPQGANVAGLCHFREVNVRLSGHAAAFQALGVTEHGQPTMDARIAPLLSTTTPYNAMYLGAGATDNGALCSTIGPCNDDPASAYKRYFDSALPEGSVDDTYLKVFESQNAALQKIRNKLSQEEKERLDVHAEALSGLENRITALMSGEGPDLDTYRPTMPSPESYANKIVATGKVQADIMIAALQAGLTNVGVLQLGNHQGTWKGQGTSYQGTLHDAAHGHGTDAGPFNEMVGNLSQVPAYIIKRLTETADANGQMLIDNTVFVQVTCMGDGMTHEPEGAPFIVATKMPGFKNGFSKAAGGTTMDLNGAIPKGLGLDEGAYAPMGSSTLGLV